jgi:hypothetical protein
VPIGRILLVVGAIAALLAAGAAAYFLFPRATPSPAPAPAPTQAAAPTAQPVPGPVTLTATADCVSPPSRDAAGAVVAYDPQQMVDGRADTAWRCDGDGVGRTVRVTFDRPVRVLQVGLVPGYAKTDPTDGVDRYAQNRRITQVRYTFDDGTTVDQPLITAATNRSLQTVPVAGITSSGMTVSIIGSVPGSAVGPNKASNRIAISELQVLGG